MNAERGLAAIHAAANSSTSTAAVAAALQPPPAAAPAKAEAAAAAPDQSAALAAARAEGKAEGVKEGATAERARIKAIVTSEKAKGREALAQSLAFDTDLSAEQAITVIGNTPAVAKSSRLDGIVPTPRVDASESGADAEAPGTRLGASMQRLLAQKGLKPVAPR